MQRCIVTKKLYICDRTNFILVPILERSEAAAELSYEKDVLENFAKFTGKHLCQRLQSQRQCFPVNLAKFSRTSFLQNTSGGCFQTLMNEV